MKKTFTLLTLGAILEYYDFAIYIFFAKAIGLDLIPVHDEVINLVVMLAIFAIGALVRPIGGLIFAHFGDKNGRKQSFAFSILLMAIPTLMIAFIPNYKIIGIFATLLLLILRAVQSFAIGGEIPASIVFAYELSKDKSKALNTNVVVAGTNIGLFTASIICAYLLKHVNNNIAAWRIAFIIGGLFGIASYFLRKNLQETPEFKNIQNIIKLNRHQPLKQLVKTNSKEIFQITSFGCFVASSIAVFSMFMPNYLATFHHIALEKAMNLNSYSMAIFIVSALIAGKFDYLFCRKFLISSMCVFDMVIIYLFHNYSRLNFPTIEMIHLGLLFYIGIICGRLPVLIASFFPTSVRYSGVALSYNISFGIVAGLSQVVLLSLIKVSGYLWIPGYYVIIFSIPALIFLIFVKPEFLYTYR